MKNVLCWQGWQSVNNENVSAMERHYTENGLNTKSEFYPTLFVFENIFKLRSIFLQLFLFSLSEVKNGKQIKTGE